MSHDDSDFEFFFDGDESEGDAASAVATLPPSAAAPANPSAAKPAESKPARRPRAANLRTASASRRDKGPDLTFDLETVPDEKRMHLFGLEPIAEYEETPPEKLPDPTALLSSTLEAAKAGLDGVSPPAAWLDELVKIENAQKKPRAGVFKLIDDKRSARDLIEEAKRERIKLLSVTPEYCSIAAFGYATGRDESLSLVVGDAWEDDDGKAGVTDERTILDEFWSLVATHGRLVGFNILGFDLSVIYARSAILGVPATRMIDLKPWGGDVLDLYAVRFPKSGGGSQPRKLKQLAPLYGVDVPAGDTDGSNVFELMQVGDFDKVGEYVRSDVDVTRGLREVLRGFYWT